MKVDFSSKALKQLKKLDNKIQKRIVNFMTDVSKLEDPHSRGKLLTGNLQGLWRYRVGKYRLVCKILDRELVILVVDIGHRKEVYDK